MAAISHDSHLLLSVSFPSSLPESASTLSASLGLLLLLRPLLHALSKSLGQELRMRLDRRLSHCRRSHPLIFACIELMSSVSSSYGQFS